MKFFTIAETNQVEKKLNDIITLINESVLKYNNRGELGTTFPDGLSKIFETIINKDYSDDIKVANEKLAMSRENIYEVMYDIIDDSMEWGFECDGNEYIHFIEGVKSMTKKLIDKMDSKNDSDSMRGETC